MMKFRPNVVLSIVNVLLRFAQQLKASEINNDSRLFKTAIKNGKTGVVCTHHFGGTAGAIGANQQAIEAMERQALLPPGTLKGYCFFLSVLIRYYGLMLCKIVSCGQIRCRASMIAMAWFSSTRQKWEHHTLDLICILLGVFRRCHLKGQGWKLVLNRFHGTRCASLFSFQTFSSRSFKRMWERSVAAEGYYECARMVAAKVLFGSCSHSLYFSIEHAQCCVECWFGAKLKLAI